MHIWNHHIQTCLHDAKRSGSENRALIVEPAHQNVHAAALAAKHVLARNFAILEDKFTGIAAAHAELVELLSRSKTLESLFDDEGGYAGRSRLLIGTRVNDQSVRHRAIGDPHFGPVEDKA